MKILSNGNKFTLYLSDDKIDWQTFTKIRNRYPEGEEMKLHRLILEALINRENPPQECLEYLSFVKECINKGKKLKTEQRISK